MEGVCRVVITVHNLMGLEFSLLTQWMPGFEGKPSGVGLFSHTKATMTCAWPVTVT